MPDVDDEQKQNTYEALNDIIYDCLWPEEAEEGTESMALFIHISDTEGTRVMRAYKLNMDDKQAVDVLKTISSSLAVDEHLRKRLN